GMLYTNIFLAIFIPAIPLLLLVDEYEGRANTRSVASAWGWFTAGILLVSLVLATVNYQIDGNFWFYRASVRVAIEIQGNLNPEHVRSEGWLYRAFWLALPLSVLAGV